MSEAAELLALYWRESRRKRTMLPAMPSFPSSPAEAFPTGALDPATGPGESRRVFRRKRVSPFAVSLPGRPGLESWSASDVLRKRDGLHVGGIAARPVSAEMVDSETLRHRAAKRLIDNAMSRAALFVDHYPAVTVTSMERPLPAGIWGRRVDDYAQCFFECHRLSFDGLERPSS